MARAAQEQNQSKARGCGVGIRYLQNKYTDPSTIFHEFSTRSFQGCRFIWKAAQLRCPLPYKTLHCCEFAPFIFEPKGWRAVSVETRHLDFKWAVHGSSEGRMLRASPASQTQLFPFFCWLVGAQHLQPPRTARPAPRTRLPGTESQNHRTVGVGRDLCGSPSTTPCPSRVTYSRLHSTASRQQIQRSPGRAAPCEVALSPSPGSSCSCGTDKRPRETKCCHTRGDFQPRWWKTDLGSCARARLLYPSIPPPPKKSWFHQKIQLQPYHLPEKTPQESPLSIIYFKN